MAKMANFVLSFYHTHTKKKLKKGRKGPQH